MSCLDSSVRRKRAADYFSISGYGRRSDRAAKKSQGGSFRVPSFTLFSSAQLFIKIERARKCKEARKVLLAL